MSWEEPLLIEVKWNWTSWLRTGEQGDNHALSGVLVLLKGGFFEKEVGETFQLGTGRTFRPLSEGEKAVRN